MGQFGLAERGGLVAFEPAGLGPLQPDGHDVLGLSRAVGVPHGFVQALPDARLTPAGPDRAEPVQRAQPDAWRWATPDQEFPGNGHGLVPAPGPLQHVGPLAAQEDRVGGEVVLVAVGHAVGVVGLPAGEVLLVDVHGVGIDVRPAHLSFMPAAHGDVQGLAHDGDPVTAHPQKGTGLGVERVADYVGTAQRPGNGHGPVGQLDRLSMLVVHHPQRGEAGVGRGQLRAWSQRFEHRYRGHGRGTTLAAPARRVQRARQPAQRVALAPLVTLLAPQGERALAGLDRLLHAVQQRGLVAERVVQAGGRGGVGLVRETQGPLVLGGRLAVGAQFRGAPGGGGRVPHDGGPVPRAFRVERHPRVVVTAGPAQGVQDPGVDEHPAVRGDRRPARPAGRSRGGTSAPRRPR